MDETLDIWLDKQIEAAENECGMLRSYRRDTTTAGAKARLNALKEVRAKMAELWGKSE